VFNRPANIYENYTGSRSQMLTTDQLIQRNDLLTQLLFPAIRESSKSHDNQLIDDFKLSHRTLEKGYPRGAMVMKLIDVGKNKMEPRYEGPFKIISKSNKGTYQLLDSTGALYPRPVPPSHLKLISIPDFYLEEDTHYEVESILNHRGSISKREYLVKWKHYPPSQNQWLPAENFDSPQLIARYWKQKRAKK
jgi:hypothetical protein